MKIRKKALLYDIANMAYVIADTAESESHALHQVRDICQDGNIHRVARVLALAYSRILMVLSPVIIPPAIELRKDFSAEVHDYEIRFRHERHGLSNEIMLKIKETAHEYMVCLVLYDWLSITYPHAAPVWKTKAEACLSSLSESVSSMESSFTCAFGRKISPL